MAPLIILFGFIFGVAGRVEIPRRRDGEMESVKIDVGWKFGALRRKEGGREGAVRKVCGHLDKQATDRGVVK